MEQLRIKALVLAVEAGLAALYAIPVHADEAQMEALKKPTNSIEVGGAHVSGDSAKFGEYSGLNKSGSSAIGNFSLRGGDAYGEENGTRRYELTGADLGLTSRNLGFSMSNQGQWDFGIRYDQLTHYTAGGYQTPYNGEMGGNVFTLQGFGAVPTAAPGTRLLTATQLGQFRNMDISNNRDNTTLIGGLVLNPQWSLKLDVNHLDQSGAKLQSFATSNFGGANANGQKIALLPMPRIPEPKQPIWH
jgi:hypothetical protein